MLRYRFVFISKRFCPFLFLFLFGNIFLYSQNHLDTSNLPLRDVENFAGIYGLDQSLYNGILYNSYYPSNVKGDQFFIDKNFLKGEVTIKGIKYNNLELNLDIYKQELLLKYYNSNKVINVIMISKAWLEEFSIGNTRFLYLGLPRIPARIYQVLGNDSIQILYFWKKDLKLDNANSTLEFSIEKESYVLISKSLKKFHNNRNFVQLFAEENQIKIKQYLQQNKIHVKDAPDQKMEELINFCSKLSIK
jgi:hypothetical protein